MRVTLLFWLSARKQITASLKILNYSLMDNQLSMATWKEGRGVSVETALSGIFQSGVFPINEATVTLWVVLTWRELMFTDVEILRNLDSESIKHYFWHKHKSNNCLLIGQKAEQLWAIMSNSIGIYIQINTIHYLSHYGQINVLKYITICR